MYLLQKGYAPTSVRNMLANIVMFFKHIEASFQSDSKLKQRDFRKFFYEMKRIQADVQKKEVVHWQKVLLRKTG